MSGSANVGGVWKDIFQPSANVGGVWKDAQEGWLNIGGIWHKWWPANELPGCPPAGNYEPLLISGGGDSGGSFAMDTYAGCGITATAAKVGYNQFLGFVGQSFDIRGTPTNTFYRTIPFDDVNSGRTIFHDMLGTAAAEFESGAATGYSISSTTPFGLIATSRLRVTL